ncbi:MAG: sulfotransferase domain-containing protein [Alphaproteobacteria bacterium]
MHAPNVPWPKREPLAVGLEDWRFTKPNPVSAAKQVVRERLLSLGGIRRLHIVGAARSGTTMVHYAMAGFANTILFNDESPVWSWPQTRHCAGLMMRLSGRPAGTVLVTKRGHDWYSDAELSRTLVSMRKHGLSLILMVRDPRDVLTSKMDGTEMPFYVEPERWGRSARATEILVEELSDNDRMLILRYEDVVREPDKSATMVATCFDLRLRPEVASWGQLEKNLAIAKQDANLARAMHGVRDLEASSVGGWYRSAERCAHIANLLETSPQRSALRRFMARYGYDGSA